MVDAGYLNPTGEIRGGAAELFFKHRDEIILEKVNAKDAESEAYDSLPREDFIRSRLEFPTFHLNWIDGILTSCLKILDFAGSVSADFKPPQEQTGQLTGPIHDPMFAFEHVLKAAPQALAQKPNLDIAKITAYFGTPGLPGETALAKDLGLIYPPPPDVIEGPKTTAFMAGMKTIAVAPKYEKRNPKDFIPLVPSSEFPNIDYPTGDQKELSLQSKQELLFTAVVDALDKLISDILATSVVLLFPISTLGVKPAPPKDPIGQQLPGPGLIAIFKAAELALDKFLPDPKAAANDALTNIVNFEALKRLLIKPLYLTAIGVLFGSHAEGFTGLMGLEAPDAVAEFNKGFGDPKPSKLDTETTADVFAASDGIPPDDPSRNNVPEHRPKQYIPDRYKDKGKGFKNEFYQKLKELGSKFASPGIVNNNADDAHRGLIWLLVFNNETGVDPGVSNIGLDKQGIWRSANGPAPSLSDAMIWGASRGNVGGILNSFTADEFAATPVWDPAGSSAEQGMDVMQQLEHYQEFLARNMAILGGKLQVGASKATAISGGKMTATGHIYGGPDPHVTNHLKESLNKYISGNIGTQKKLDNCPPKEWYPMTMPGSLKAFSRAPQFKEYGAPFYYIQNPYDLYAFHIGIQISGDSLAFSVIDENAAGRLVEGVFRPAKPLYTIASRAITLVQDKEHIPRYMEANGMSSIDWDKVGVVGLKRYVDDRGNWTSSSPVFPDPVPWSNENKDELDRMRDLVKSRAEGNI